MLEKLRYDEISENSISVSKNSDLKLSEIKGDAPEIKVTLSAPLPDDFGIKLLGDNAGKEFLTISADKSNLKAGNVNAPLVLGENEV